VILRRAPDMFTGLTGGNERQLKRFSDCVPLKIPHQRISQNYV
jgi:hypothetical protein